MNESSLLLFESKWKSFLKESQDIDVDALADEILNGQRPFTRTSSIKPKTQPKVFRNPIKNKLLLHNIEIIGKDYNHEILKSLYKNNLLTDTPLAWIKLEKKIGAGSYSRVYLTDENKVLKMGGVRNLAKEEPFYQKLVAEHNPNFKVFYYKRFEPKFPDIFILLTNYLEPFPKFVKEHRRENSDVINWPGPLSRFYIQCKNVLEYDLPEVKDSKKIMEYIKKYIPRPISDFKQYFFEHFNLPENESYLIMEEIVKNVIEGHDDLHLRNLGVNLDNGPENPSFFFFDV